MRNPVSRTPTPTTANATNVNASVGAKRFPAFDKSKFQYAYDFWNDIAPEMLRRQLGVKKLDKRYIDAFKDMNKVPVVYGKLDKKRIGQYNYWRYKRSGKLARELITLAEKATPRTLVHELRHAFAQRIPITDETKKILDRTFGYSKVDIDPERPGYSKRMGTEEAATTLMEHQYAIYEALRRELKDKFRPYHFFNKLKSMESQERRGNRWNTVNRYQQISDAQFNDLKSKLDSEYYFNLALPRIVSNSPMLWRNWADV